MHQLIQYIRQNERGLTLVEVLAAMAILSIIVVAFLNISGYMTLAFGKSNEETKAIRIAEDVLNEKRNAIDTAAIRPVETDPSIVSASNVGDYTITVYVTAVNNNSYTLPSNSKHVSVQAIVLLDDSVTGLNIVPRLLTVIVSWGDSTP